MGFVDQILRSMIQRGSVPAQYRQSELNTLRQLLRLLEDCSTQSHSNMGTHSSSHKRPATEHTQGHNTNDQDSILTNNIFGHLGEVTGETGVSSAEMLEVARLLEGRNFLFDDNVFIPGDQFVAF